MQVVNLIRPKLTVTHPVVLPVVQRFGPAAHGRMRICHQDNAPGSSKLYLTAGDRIKKDRRRL
jgi:hypothetical protein